MKHSLFLSCCLAVCASGVLPVIAQTFSNGLPAKQIVLSQKAHEALKGKQILYIEREQYAPDHHNTATLFQPGEINEASFAPGGAMRVYDVDSGKIRTLIETTEGVVRDPEISFDGQKVLFSMRQHPKDSYHLYEMNIDGSGLRQLTFAEGVSDIDPIYLPDGNIIFTSTRQPKYCMCNRHIMGNLFRMEADGANITQIGVSTLFEGHASLLSDGRVLYDRWEYVDRNFGDAQGLWVVNPDGTKHAIYYGNNTASPGGVIDGRQIPNSDLVVCTFTSCHERPWGAMAIIDRRKGVDNEAALVDIWPKESAKWVGNGNLDSFKSVGTFYEDPFPLDENNFLVSRTIWVKSGGWNITDAKSGIYYVNRDGTEELLLEGNQSLFDPMLVEVRQKPVSIPMMRNFTAEEGQFYVENVYEGTHMAGVKPGSVKYLRVVESPEKRTWTVRGWFGEGEQAPGMPDLTNEQIQKEVMNLHTAIYQKFNYEMKYIRPPKGEYSERTVAYTNTLGYKTVMWSFAYDDWDKNKQGREEYGKKMVLSNIHPGAVILLHATSKDNSNILDDCIKEIKQMGYEFRSLDQFQR